MSKIGHSKRLIYFFGIKRSGQHALIEWIAKHFSGLIGFTNSAQSFPLQSFRVSHYMNVDMNKQKEMRDREHYGAEIDKEVHFITYEDIHRKVDSLHEAKERIESVDLTRLVGTCDYVQYVACIRDFYNNMASRMKMSRSRKATTCAPHRYMDECNQWWISWAKESMDVNSTFIWINYNTWMQDRHYRRSLELRLGLNSRYASRADSHSQTEIAQKHSGGHGSSFDKFTQTHQQGERYLQMLDDPEYREKVLSDDEARDLNLKIFGWTLTHEGTRYSAEDAEGRQAPLQAPR